MSFFKASVKKVTSLFQIDAAFTKSALKSVYLGNSVQKFYTLGGNVIINSTVRLEDNPSTRQRGIRNSLQRHLIKVIQAHGNNIGNSALWVDGPVNPVPAVDGEEMGITITEVEVSILRRGGKLFVLNIGVNLYRYYTYQHTYFRVYSV